MLAIGDPTVVNSAIAEYADAPDVIPAGATCDAVAFQDDAERFHLWSAVAPQRFEDVFYYGSTDDLPIAGDSNGDRCETLSIYRP